MVLLLSAGVVACNGSTNPEAEEADGSDSGDGRPEEPEGERIIGVGVGDGPDELSYAGVDSLEMEAWGPAAYVVDERGLNWIADGPGHKVLVLDDDGEIVDRYDLEGLVRGVEDIEVTPTHLYVLTLGGAEPVLARTGRNDVAATAWETFPIPTDELDATDITGLREDADGAVSVELAFGREHLPVFAADGTLIVAPGAPVAEYEVGGRTVELLGYSGDPQDDPSTGAILVDGVEVASVETVGTLGAFSLIGATPEGDLWIRVADVGIADGAFATRSLAYRFTLDGALVEVVEMPMREEVVWVEHRIAMEPEGDLRVLSAGPDEVSLLWPAEIGLPAASELPPGVTPYLPANQEITTGEPVMTAGGGDQGPCMSREEIMQRAYEYANYEAVYNASHMQNCPGRTPLSYFEEHLGQPIRGVAYKYAGHIEVSTYHDAVMNGYTIGDLNTKSDKVVDNCSYGVDCSGFVSKAWRSGHYTTSSLHQVSTVLGDVDLLQPGDALNKPGSHVRLIAEYHGSAGVKVIESTVGSEWMRVVVREVSLGEAGHGKGYQPIRYDNLCPAAPPPPATTHVIFDASGYLPAGSGYVPVGPARLLDTREDDQEYVGPLPTDENIAVTVAGRAGIPEPEALGAVVLNLTVALPEGHGFLAAYPDGAYPGTSNINFAAGEPTPGLVIVDPGDDGKVQLRHVTAEGTSHVIVDAFGWFPPSADLHMVTPARIFDSREDEFGAAKLPTGTTELQLAGVGGIPAAGVGAVIANVAAVDPAGPGYATVYEAGKEQPETSNLNYVAGVARANLVIVPVSDQGRVSLYTLEKSHYIVDVLGWFGEGVDFEPIPPIRLRDTRFDDAEPLGHGSWIGIDVVGAPTIPSEVAAIFGNLTAAESTSPGYLQVYPGGDTPSTSNVNFVGGKPVANAVIAEVPVSGTIRVRAALPPQP